jgi:hypothetical protein
MVSFEDATVLADFMDSQLESLVKIIKPRKKSTNVCFDEG